MKKNQLTLFIVLINWQASAGITSVKEEISATVKNKTGIETPIKHPREGKHYGSFGSHESFGSYGSGSSSSEAFDVTIVKQLECPFAYTEVDELCLAYLPCVSPPSTVINYIYDDARAYCQTLDTGGGDLVTFKDTNEYQSIVNYIHQMDPGSICNYWLGATKATSTSINFQFVDGTSLSNSGPFWYTGEPIAANLFVLFAKNNFYRLATDASGTSTSTGAICQYRPGNVTLTQRIFPRRPPQVIPIPYPVEIKEKRGGGAGGSGWGGGRGSSNVTTNLDVSLAGSNFSSEQNANFQNAPVINIETHSHFIDNSPEIIPIPSYPLPANGTTYGSPPYPQPGYPYNTYVPHPHYYNPYPKPGGEYASNMNGGYALNPSGYGPIPSGDYTGTHAQGPARVNNPLIVHRPHSVINSGHSLGNVANVPNQLPPKLVSRDDKLKAASPNRTNVQKINMNSIIASRPKSHPQIFNSVHVERVDGFKQRSRDPVPPENKMTPPISKEIPPLREEVPQLNKEKENEVFMEPENVASQLTLLLDMIDKKYGDSNDNILIKDQSMTHPIGNVSKAEEAAYLIKVMNELQAMILKIEHLDHTSTINTNKSPPSNIPNRQKHKNPIIGSRRMQGSRLLDI